ncbi:MAG: hypothetical protein LBF83_05340 [Spirochaetaceae bacterium]|jgi:hypothetical protein|nr:hypothetical protein [Spirochaetaceae bacterium]
MADKLDWLGKHLVLIRHLTVADAVSMEGYKIPPDLVDVFEDVSSAEEAAFKLAKLEKYKNVCELMAYIAHHRAGIWWGYRCVCSLNEELRLKPPEEFYIKNPPAPPSIPDYFNFDVPKPDPELMSAMGAALAEVKSEAAAGAALLNPAMKKYVADGVAEAFHALEKANGIHPMALLKKLGERMKQDPYAIDPNSPVFRMKRELKEKAEVERARIIAEVKDGHAAVGITSPLNKNPKLAAHREKLKGSALAAVYRWASAPNEENSKSCLDIGNECTGAPEGLLALSAFWAFGNLAPKLDRVIPTPPGLAANGLDKVLLMCAVQQGGIRKVKERYELYFNLGVDVLSGKDNWEESLALGKPPHEEPLAMNNEQGADGKEQGGGNDGYKRWKPPAG